jgi:hypothetical protein
MEKGGKQMTISKIIDIMNEKKYRSVTIIENENSIWKAMFFNHSGKRIHMAYSIVQGWYNYINWDNIKIHNNHFYICIKYPDWYINIYPLIKNHIKEEDK